MNSYFLGGQRGRQLTLAEAYQLAVEKGFKPGVEAATAAALSRPESSGIVNNFNPNDPHGGSVGLMQINGANAGLIGGENWKTVGQDPGASMAAAHALYARRGNFSDWGAYNSGAYKPYMSQAMAIANGSPVTAAAPGTSLTSHPFTPPHTLTPTTAGAPYTAEAVAAANPPRPAAPADTAPQTPFDWAKKALTRPPDTVDKDGNPVKGKSPLESLAGKFDKPPGQEAPAAPEQPALAPVGDPMAGLAGPAAQLYATIQAQAAKPLSWSSRPYGSDAGLQMNPGMTLNTAGY